MPGSRLMSSITIGVVGIEREHEHREQHGCPDRLEVGLLEDADPERQRRQNAARRAPRGGRRTATPVAGSRRSWRARGCRTRAPRPGATGARARRSATAAMHAPLPPAARSSASASVRASSKSALAKLPNVPACSSAPIAAATAEPSSTTMPSATRSSCCRATARRHIVASKLRPPCGPRLIPRDYSGAPCASRPSPCCSCSFPSRARSRGRRPLPRPRRGSSPRPAAAASSCSTRRGPSARSPRSRS